MADLYRLTMFVGNIPAGHPVWVVEYPALAAGSLPPIEARQGGDTEEWLHAKHESGIRSRKGLS